MLLGALAIDYVFVGPYYSFRLEPDHATWLLAFLLISAAIILLFEARRRTERELYKESASFRVTLGSIADGVVTTDLQGRVTFMNPVAERLSGWDLGQAVGRAIHEIIRIVDEENRRPLSDIVSAALEKGGPVDLDPRALLIARDGSERPIEDSAAPIRDAEGDTLGVVVVFRDTTERRRGERALRESETLFRNLANVTPVMMWQSGPDRLATWFNQRWLDFTGRSLEDELGTGWLDRVHPDDLPRCRQIYDTSAGARMPFRVELRLRRADGRYRWFLNEAAPTYGPSGGFTGYVGSCIDITERIEAEEALRNLNETLEHRVEDRTRAVEGAADALRREAGFVRLLQAVAVAANEAERVEDAMRRALQEVCKVTGWPIGHAYNVSEDRTQLISTGMWCYDEDGRWESFRKFTEGLSMPLGEGFPGTVGATREPMWIVDVGEPGRFRRAEVARQAGLRSAFAFPVLSGQSVSAVMEFLSTEFIEPDEQLLDVMRHVGTQLGRVIERVHAVEEEHRLLQQTEAAEYRFRMLLESAPDSVVIVDSGGRIVLVNSQTENIFKYNRKELLQMDIAALVPERFRAVHEGHRLDYSAHPQVRPMGLGRELHGLRSDGTEFPVEISLSPLDTPDGRLVMSIVRDITDRTRMEEALRQSERLAAIGQMITGLSHESRNALQRSLACLEMLGRKLQDQPAAQRILQEAFRAQTDLKQVYEEVREYAGPMLLQRSKEPLERIWREAWNNLASQREGRQATLHEIIDGVDTTLQLDPFRMQQVFRNLLENSLAACGDPADIVISCTSSGASNGNALTVVVRDNGPGLNPEQEARLFEPFYTTKVKGTGLGMAIVKRIVESHGGQILVTHGAGPGLELTLVLPRSTL
jgi:PAS domain S-box-containing protein